MTIYLVDFENVKSEGLNGVQNLNDEDIVEVFYSVNADKITIKAHSLLNTSKAKVNFNNVDLGAKNALDFQLDSYLGYLIAKNEDKEFVIVTKDNGYSSVVSFWTKRNIKISIASDLSMKNMNAIHDEMLVKVKACVEDQQQAELLTDYIFKYKTKQGLNNAIVKVYGTTTGGKLYKAIKSLINDKKGK